MARETFTGYTVAPHEEMVVVSAEVEERLLYDKGPLPVAGHWRLTDWRIETDSVLPDGIRKVKVIAYGPRILEVKVHNHVVVSIAELAGG